MVCDQHENGPLKLLYVTNVSVPSFFLVPIILLVLLTAANHHILSQVFIYFHQCVRLL